MTIKHPKDIDKKEIADHLCFLADGFADLESKAKQVMQDQETRYDALHDFSNQVSRKILGKGQAMLIYQHYYQLYSRMESALYIESKDIDCPTVRQVAKFMHNTYESKAHEEEWKTQEKCQVPFDDLPEANKNVMLYVAYKTINFVWGLK